MTTLICSGTLFSSGWEMLPAFLPAEASDNPVCSEIASLGEEMCRFQYPDSDELDWKPFSPDSKFRGKASRLLSSIENESLICWGNSTDSLYLDYWRATVKNAGFVLFYSSPELELSHYISSHKFEASRVEKVINAWVIRTQALLTFFMNNRDRCLLADVKYPESANKAFTEALNTKFDLDLEPGPINSAQQDQSSALIAYLSTTLLLNRHHISELYDEVRSAASLITEEDKSIPGINDRNKSLIGPFLADVTAFQQLGIAKIELESVNQQISESARELGDKLSLKKLQVDQMREELEYYFKMSTRQEEITATVSDYLRNDPLLKVARRVRQMS